MNRRARARIDGVALLAVALLVIACSSSWGVAQVRGREPHPEPPPAAQAPIPTPAGTAPG